MTVSFKDQNYILTGEEPFLLEETLASIQNHHMKNEELHPYRLEANSEEHWQTIFQIQQQYDLWSDKKWIELFYAKKTIDSSTQSHFHTLLNQADEHCFIIIKAPLTNAKTWAPFLKKKPVTLIHFTPLSPTMMKQRIKKSLNLYTEDPSLIELIYHYTEGSLQACHQLFEKLLILYPEKIKLSHHDILPHLYDQTQYARFALSEACLLGDLFKSIRILKQAKAQHTEMVLMLWIITQDIRTLLQLKEKFKKTNSGDAFRALNIWTQKIPLYEKACSRLTEPQLWALLTQTQTLDTAIKTNTLSHGWDALEQIVIALCDPKTENSNEKAF